ncbi:DNA polymerase beta superfamily protein [Nocardia ignorata]|uniref:Putative nucleotidyltransferase n=1 Tax=Nocardia ignorata TaxID=145285 RepID=A0A4R6P3D6_NOCIG|nr:nucleotidyltransferase domain-containing protein [Nocardia ignorata]TDP29811.1 putative nucleotidyltransferase [Nocardia ignorata]
MTTTYQWPDNSANDNPHGTDRHAAIARRNTVLLGQVGSGLHGVTTGNDDRDEMGVCIESPVSSIPVTNNGKVLFEQYIYRSQAEGVRSGAGDLDLLVYSLRKWSALAAQGNPTVLLLAFIPASEIVIQTDIGRDIQANPERWLSRQVAQRFGGYLISQRDQLLGVKSKKHTNRPELVDVYGFDTKFAYHMVRLGLQGVELLTTGRVTLPIPEPDRTWLQELRRGEHTKDEALARAADLLDQLNQLAESADLPPQPNHAEIGRWLTDTYVSWWEQNGLIGGCNV